MSTAACVLHAIVCLGVSSAEAPAKADRTQTDVVLTAAQARALGVETEQYGLAAVRQPIVSMGTVTYDASRLAHVYSPVTGIVARVLAPLGAQVQSGQPLALLSSADMAAAKADLDRATANGTAAEQESARQEKLFSQAAASARDVEGARDNLRRTQAERTRALQRYALLAGGKHASGDQNYWLRSPIDGEVVAREINLGDQVQGQYAGGAGNALYTIADLDSLWLLADLHESEVGRVKIGAQVWAKPADPGSLDAARLQPPAGQKPAAASPPAATAVGALGREPSSAPTVIAGKVDWLADVIDPNAHTLKVRCTVDNRDRRLRANAKVVIEMDGGVSDVMSLPQASIVCVEQQAYVFVAVAPWGESRQLFRLRPVEVNDDAIGHLDSADSGDSAAWPGKAPGHAALLAGGNEASVLRRRTLKSGVRPGERVVTAGADALLGALAASRSAPAEVTR